MGIRAGGYDPRIAENTAYHSELVALCTSLGLKHVTCKTFISALSVPPDTNVLFLLSIPASWKAYLLRTSSLLVYTPEKEHFGIVPLEAMMEEVCSSALLHKLPDFCRNVKQNAWAFDAHATLLQGNLVLTEI